MTVTNNRSSSATFMFKWNNTTQKEFFEAFETRSLPKFAHIDQILSRQFIVNRTTSGGDTDFIAVTTPSVANNRIVDAEKPVDPQIIGFWEIEI